MIQTAERRVYLARGEIRVWAKMPQRIPLLALDFFLWLLFDLLPMLACWVAKTDTQQASIALSIYSFFVSYHSIFEAIVPPFSIALIPFFFYVYFSLFGGILCDENNRKMRKELQRKNSNDFLFHCCFNDLLMVCQILALTLKAKGRCPFPLGRWFPGRWRVRRGPYTFDAPGKVFQFFPCPVLCLNRYMT